MKSRVVLIVALSLGLASVAEARSQRVQQVPNSSEFQCGLCHVSSFPTGAQNAERNVFGAQVEANLTGGGNTATMEVDWPAIYDMDADEDGFTNGEELGDPNGEWQSGEEPPEGYEPSHPADPDDTPDLGGDDAGGDGGGDQDAGGGDDDAGSTSDVGSDAGVDAEDGSSGSDDGCTTTGLHGSAPASGLAALLLFGLAALRRRN